jgi:hypothetical protein
MTAIGGSAFDLFDDLALPVGADGGAVAGPTGRRVAVLVLAGALLLGGTVVARAALAAGGSDTAPRVAPGSLFAALDAPQRAADRIVSEPGTEHLDPTSTRLLGETAAGRHYVAVADGGLLCLATIAAGSVADVGCTEPVAGVDLTASWSEPAAVTVRLVADQDVASVEQDAAWTRVGPNLYRER